MTPFVRAALAVALLHITPAVTLVKRPDAVHALLPGADAFVARDIHLSDRDAHRLHETVDWSPADRSGRLFLPLSATAQALRNVINTSDAETKIVVLTGYGHRVTRFRLPGQRSR